jgi:CBS domain containing-hemolysin-like protein
MLGKALGSRQTTFPLVDSEGHLSGVVRVQDLHRALDDRGALEGVLVAADLGSPVRALRETENLEQALEMLTDSGTDLLPVVDDQNRLMGTVFAQDVLGRYAHELQKLRLASTLAQRKSFSMLTDGLELGHGMRLAEVEVAPSMVGRSLRDLQLRPRHGVEVLYVLKGPYRIRKLADPDLSLDLGDHLVVMAEASSLLAFRQEIAPGAP